ncbi:MAG: DUF4238 domain-containing protein [Candidatus Eisenbacteria bacterium]
MSGEGLATRQHYVPQFLLRRFSREVTKNGLTSDRLAVLDLREDRLFEASVNDVACSNRFYEAAVGEDMVLTIDPGLAQLESMAAPAIARLLKSQDTRSLTPEERSAISLFVVVQGVRSPATRRSVEAMPDLVRKKLEESGPIAQSLRDQMSTAGEDGAHMHLRIMARISEFWPVLAERTWRLHVVPDRSRFCSSDSPAIRFNQVDAGPYGNLGLLCRGLVLQLALSTRVVLAIIDSGVYEVSEGEVVNLTRENLLWYNSVLAFHADRFLYALNPDDFDIREGMWADQPKITPSFFNERAASDRSPED